jgi:O-antigen ligase
MAAIVKRRVGNTRKPQIIAAILAVGGLVALWASFSRSAWLAAVIAVVIVAIPALYNKISRKVWIISVVIIGIIIGGGLTFGSGSSFLSNIILHDNPNGGSSTKSDQGHLSSVQSATSAALHQPLGAGVGSTGSASLLTNHPLIIENQYLFTAHEAGWLGLILFGCINVWILVRLWKKRSDYVALGVFASGIGLVIIGFLLPVWTDDTVSIIWWGFAALVIGGKSYVVDNKGKKL